MPTGPRYTFRVAAVVRLPSDIAVDEVRSIGQSAFASTNGILVSHEFYERHRQEFLDFGVGYDIELNGGEHARDDFIAAVEARARERGESALFGPPRFQDRRGSLESPVELETSSLFLLGVGVALAGTLTIALLLRAEQRSHERDEPTFRALGCTSGQLGAAALLRTRRWRSEAPSLAWFSPFPCRPVSRWESVDSSSSTQTSSSTPRSSSWAAPQPFSSSAGSATFSG